MATKKLRATAKKFLNKLVCLITMLVTTNISKGWDTGPEMPEGL
jgi:hypothetical protein